MGGPNEYATAEDVQTIAPSARADRIRLSCGQPTMVAGMTAVVKSGRLVRALCGFMALIPPSADALVYAARISRTSSACPGITTSQRR
jgi:hypothetical protein